MIGRLKGILVARQPPWIAANASGATSATGTQSAARTTQATSRRAVADPSDSPAIRRTGSSGATTRTLVPWT